VTTLQALVESETAGDPMTGHRWVRRSLRHLSGELDGAGHPASPPTVSRLLRALDYGLHANAKQVEAASRHPDREAQFTHLTAQRRTFQATGWPVLSVDTKKKELVGNFRNAGAVWCRAPEAVNVHDFPQDALGRAVPYGIYDLNCNRGAIYVGTSADTPRFAVDVLARWWEEIGHATYPDADQLLLLADAGGSNGCRSRLWKYQLQAALCDRFGLTVTVCHYPTGCSKYNPVEHRLFSPISINWAAQPLRSWDTLLACIRGTTTSAGLTVLATLHDQPYVTGERVANAAMATLALERHAVCPVWNYTIRPRPSPPNREVIS
jgi:hypothetical protein